MNLLPVRYEDEEDMIYDDDDDDDEVGGEKVHDIYDDNDGFRSTDI